MLNRYYGVFENGKIKTRGIEARRRDTPKFIFDAQMEMIKKLAEARNSREFVGKIPQALEVAKQYKQRLLNGEIPLWDLIVTKHLSKDPARYKQKVSQVIAAEQLMKEGAEVSAGKNIRFLFTSAENRRYERRVRTKELVDAGKRYDLEKYLHLLRSATENLLNGVGAFTTRFGTI